jgi:hypothetical protein
MDDLVSSWAVVKAPGRAPSRKRAMELWVLIRKSEREALSLQKAGNAAILLSVEDRVFACRAAPIRLDSGKIAKARYEEDFFIPIGRNSLKSLDSEK